VRDRRFKWLPLFRFFKAWIEPSLEPDDLRDPQGRALGWHYRRRPTEAAAQVFYLVRATRRVLREIQIPTLIVQSPRDSTLDPEGARWAFEQISTIDKKLHWLKHSGHNIAIDAEREQVFEQTYRFISRVASLPPAESTSGTASIANAPG
jgi:carboxylesterase